MKYAIGKNPNSWKNSPLVKGHKINVGRIMPLQVREKIRKTLTGRPGKKGWHHSEQTIEKMRVSAMGNKNALGCHPSKETRELIRKSKLGIKRPAWVVEKMGCNRKGKCMGTDHWRWKGGKIIGIGGYVMIRIKNHHRVNKNGYVQEHVIVAEKKIGRNLMKNECVHHKNGIRTDNRPENLEVMTRNEHSKEHYKNRKLNILGQLI